MKQNIKFSAYSLIVTAVVLILCVVGIFSLIGNAEKLTLFCIIVCLCISSCSLDKRVSVPTGRYDNLPNRHVQQHYEIETSRDTVATIVSNDILNRP